MKGEEVRQMWTEVLNEGGTESTTYRVAFVEIDNETERLIVILIGSGANLAIVQILR